MPSFYEDMYALVLTDAFKPCCFPNDHKDLNNKLIKVEHKLKIEGWNNLRISFFLKVSGTKQNADVLLGFRRQRRQIGTILFYMHFL